MAKCPNDGRPNKYNAETMQAAVDDYFRWAEENHKMPSIGGLALHLGFTSRHALNRYCEDNAESASNRKSNKTDLVSIISRAKLKIEEANVQALYNRDMTRGAQFVLQNGFGYSEKQEIRHDAVINVQITED